MPWQGGSIQGDPWHDCDRCKRKYRMSQLVRQRGYLVCTRTCWDDPIGWERERLIEDSMRASTEELEMPDLLKTVDTELIEF